jgi:hypothetical protein
MRFDRSGVLFRIADARRGTKGKKKTENIKIVFKPPSRSLPEVSPALRAAPLR